MQIQVNSKHTMHTGESFERWASGELHESLSRFKGDITRIEVHMSDENGDKASPDQKRCVMEARLAHHDPLAVNHQAPNQDLAFRGASDKLKRVLDHTLGKLRDHHRDRETIRREPEPEAGTP
ncbi:HPF/RaiA family ribosome-associated protein [Polaromonas sp. YR568]|uniref:HPF/RaiA family ribosome-associated protein n=1 Tax=Polaromonas sp. YR568 TaxID=1855301 RepID=UPI00398C0645